MNIFLTGDIGVGKTTAIKRFLDKTNLSYGGFLTEKLKAEVILTDLISGKMEIVAKKDNSNWKVIKKGFDSPGKSAIERALAQSDIVVMDELGRFEIDCWEFQKAVFHALNIGSQTDLPDGSQEVCGYPKPKLILGVLKNESNPFLDNIRSLKDIVILKVTKNNREDIPELIEKNIRETE